MSAGQTLGMSIATRPAGGNLGSGSRDPSGDTIGSSWPPEVLLADGGNPAPAPALAPTRVLARDATRLIRSRRQTISPEGLGRGPAVAAVKRQIHPIQSRGTLADSYRREWLHHTRPVTAEALEVVAAVRIAYAIRWFELGRD